MRTSQTIGRITCNWQNMETYILYKTMIFECRFVYVISKYSENALRWINTQNQFDEFTLHKYSLRYWYLHQHGCLYCIENQNYQSFKHRKPNGFCTKLKQVTHFGDILTEIFPGNNQFVPFSTLLQLMAVTGLKDPDDVGAMNSTRKKY